MAKIKKVQICEGSYWIEIPEAKLKILCGCPADSMKFLMKQGLVIIEEINGICAETGPNAILLSDTLIQNGQFSNLAEFPVLQMLYKQGMIIPNHPNNTGEKPLLIGNREQISSQLNYIYRGNYGLITKEEILKTGVAPETAEQMWQIKLKFAFGTIRHPKDLLDSLIVEHHEVEIKNQVKIKRTELNVFEIRYGDEKVTVNLNLEPGGNYTPPYPLGFHQIKREYFGVIHTGEGDGWDINRPCMSSILMFQGKIYLIDAGPNILGSLLALGIGINEVEGIFHTHCHDDHFVGLPILMRSDHRIKYYATQLVQSSVSKKLSALMSFEEENFADYFDINIMQFSEWHDIDGLEVMPLYSPHPVENNIFMFRALWEGGFHTYAHFADTTDFKVLQNMLAKDKNSPGITQYQIEQYKETYLTPAQLKKIDIGGGMIHGNAEDFNLDSSEKLILSHTNVPLTARQKEIGSGASFGSIDTLIVSSQNYSWRFASEVLNNYFPSVPHSQLRILLNNQIIGFNPGAILIKKGTTSAHVYLLLTGNLEMVQSDNGICNVLSAGELIGETSGLMNTPNTATYRAINFVQTLRIHKDLYLNFVKSNRLLESIKLLQENRDFLNECPLFGESLSSTIQNKIAYAMTLQSFPGNQEIETGIDSGLYLIKKGQLQTNIGQEVFEINKTGEFIGEDYVLFNSPSMFHVKTVEPADLFKIPADVLTGIPIIRWKLYEQYEKRMKKLLNSELGNNRVFTWREEFSVHIHAMDNHHKKLFKTANALFNSIERSKARPVIEKALNFLVKYSEVHFMAEETLMKEYDFPEYDSHVKKHVHMTEQVLEFQKSLNNNEIEIDMTFVDFFKGWIINHILAEDRKYTRYLNDKGVY
jgi:hemerythrin